MIADIVAEDRDGRDVLLVEIKAGIATREDIQTFFHDALSAHLEDRWCMFVDLETIAIFPSAREDPSSPLLELKTVEILRHYSEDFNPEDFKNVAPEPLRRHMRVLVDVWLGDLAWHWADYPPARDEMGSIALLYRLRAGRTRQEVSFRAEPSLR